MRTSPQFLWRLIWLFLQCAYEHFFLWAVGGILRGQFDLCGLMCFAAWIHGSPSGDSCSNLLSWRRAYCHSCFCHSWVSRVDTGKGQLDLTTFRGIQMFLKPIDCSYHLLHTIFLPKFSFEFPVDKHANSGYSPFRIRLAWLLHRWETEQRCAESSIRLCGSQPCWQAINSVVSICFRWHGWCRGFAGWNQEMHATFLGCPGCHWASFSFCTRPAALSCGLLS